MAMPNILWFALTILPSLAINKDCHIDQNNPIKKYEVKTPSEIFPMLVYLSSVEKLNFQIKFKNLEYSKDNDHIVISSEECSVIKKREGTTVPKKQLNCSYIAPGWHQADVNITSTVLGLGKLLNYTLDYQISTFVTTANNSFYCSERLPTWKITEELSAKIPLSEEDSVNLVLESHGQFSPILHTAGSNLSLSWYNKSIAISQGLPLPEGKYVISIYNRYEKHILTVNPIECDYCQASVTNLGGRFDVLGISSKKGTIFSILDLDNIIVFPGRREDPMKKSANEGNPNVIILIALTSVFGCTALVSVIVCWFIWKIKNSPKSYEDPEQKMPLLKLSNKQPRNKVDIDDITKHFCQLTEHENKLIKMWKLNMEENHHDSENKLQLLSLGSLTPNMPTKSILILGETGTGKSTTINAMVNFMFGIELKDKERFCLIENSTQRHRNKLESQTEFMTAYVLPYRDGMPNHCNYIIIDTPGFGDTRGFERDQQIMLQLKNFLKQDYRINQIDVVGFVVKATAPRLTISQRYIYDGLFSMFGKDINHNIFLLVNFAGTDDPTVLKSLKDANMQYKEYFKFNNDSLYLTYKEDGTDENFDQPDTIRDNWEMTEENFQRLFESINIINPVSLSLTKIVLEENTRLRSIVGYLRKQITEGLDKLSELKSKQIKSGDPESTKLIEQEIQLMEEHLVNSIKEAQQLTERLKEIPLRLDPLSVHGYIEQLISNELKEELPNFEQRIHVLEKLKEEHYYLKAVMNKEQSPGIGWLHYFQKIKEE